VSTECVIPSRHHRMVIGTKWTNINDITQRYNVSIKFPDRATPSATPEGTLLLLLLRLLLQQQLLLLLLLLTLLRTVFKPGRILVLQAKPNSLVCNPRLGLEAAKT